MNDLEDLKSFLTLLLGIIGIYLIFLSMHWVNRKMDEEKSFWEEQRKSNRDYERDKKKDRTS